MNAAKGYQVDCNTENAIVASTTEAVYRTVSSTLTWFHILYLQSVSLTTFDKYLPLNSNDTSIGDNIWMITWNEDDMKIELNSTGILYLKSSN